MDRSVLHRLDFLKPLKRRRNRNERARVLEEVKELVDEAARLVEERPGGATSLLGLANIKVINTHCWEHDPMVKEINRDLVRAQDQLDLYPVARGASTICHLVTELEQVGGCPQCARERRGQRH